VSEHEPTARFTLPEADARALVRLLGEVCLSQEQMEGKRRRVMQGLCNLIEADHWVWVRSPVLKPGEMIMPSGILHGGFSDSQFSAYNQLLAHPELAKLNAPFLELISKQENSQFTRLQKQLDPENQFPQLSIYSKWRCNPPRKEWS